MSGTRASAPEPRRGRSTERRGRRDRKNTDGARAPEPKNVVSGAGQPLDPGVRREWEERLGHDLSRVRLHTDREAGTLAALLGADAVAVGQDILFREGAYLPGTAEGRRLLAHEVLHTVQNPHGLGTLRAGRELGAVSLAPQPVEREAESAARQLTDERHAPALGESAPDVATGRATPGWLRYATVDADRARTERLDPATLADRLAKGVLRSLRGDPADASGRVREQLGRMAPELQDSVLDRLEPQLTAHQHDRLLDLAEEAAGTVPRDFRTAGAPEAIPDVLELLDRERRRYDRAHPVDERRRRPGRPPAEEERAGEETDEERASEERAPAPTPARTPAAGASGADRQARQNQREAEASGARDEEDRNDARQEKESRADRRTRDERAEDEPAPEPEDRQRDSESVAQPEAVDEDAADPPLARDRDASHDEPDPDVEPLGLDPSADGATATEQDDEDAELDPDSAWNTELRPDDFLPATDLDVSAVPTADELTPGASPEDSTPTFPAPPPTRAEQVREEREREAATDPAAAAEAQDEPPAEASAATAGDPPEGAGSEPAAGQSVEQDVGPAPETGPVPEPEPADAAGPAGDPTVPDPADAAEPATAPVARDPEQDAEDPEPAVEPAVAPEPEPEAERVPERADTAEAQSRALGGAGTARLASPAPAPRTAPPTEGAAPSPTATPAAEPGGSADPATPVEGRRPGAARDDGEEAPAPGPTRRTSRAASAPPGPAAPPASGGGRGTRSTGAKRRKKERSAPRLATTDPETGLSTAAGLRPHAALEAMDGVGRAVGNSVGQERQALADAPPSTERPAGSPETRHGAPDTEAPVDYTGDDVATTEDPQREDAEVEGSEAPDPDGELPGEDMELSTGQMIGAGLITTGAKVVNYLGNLVGYEDDIIDTDGVLQHFLDLPDADEALAQADLGTAPGVELAGETEGLAGDQGANLDERGDRLQAEGAEDSQQNLGEDQIYPDVPQETLSGRAPSAPGGPGPRGGGSGPAGGEVPPEALSEVAEHERGPEIRAGFAKGQTAMATEREAKETGFRESQQRHERDVQTEIETNSARQTAEREAARTEVTASRARWREEQDAELAATRGRKSERHEAVRTEVAEREEQTDQEVEDAETEEREAIETEETTANEKPAKEKERAERESGNWVADAVDAIVDLFNEIKNAILEAFRAARDAIVSIVEGFVEAVTRLIDEAREFIVETFQAFVEFIVELGRTLLAAIQEIAASVRDFVVGLVNAAIALINELASMLRDAVNALLDAITSALSGLLDALARGLEAAVALVKGALNAVMDFARGLLQGLGEWMAVAVDIISDPGGWLGNAASAAHTGSRDHLFTETQAAVKEWFNQKIQEVLGLDQETFELLLSGGMSREEIVAEAWAAILPQLPLIIGELVITKVVAKLIPGAGWVLAIIDAIQAAIGALGEILRAFGLVLDFFKAVKGGNAARPFAKAVAAGIVALLELIYQALLSGIGKYVGRVADRLRGVARGLRDKSPDQPDNDERRAAGAEVNAANQQSDQADRQNTRPPPPPAATTTTSDRRGEDDRDRGREDDPDRRDDDRRDDERRADRPPRKPRPPQRKPAPATRSHRRAKQTTKAALARNRRAKRALGRDNRGSRTAKDLDKRATRTRDAYRDRRDQLRRQRRGREEQRRRRRDERERRENSTQSKADRLRKIIARIKPSILSLLNKGVGERPLRVVLDGLRRLHRLTTLSMAGADDFSIVAHLNPEGLVTRGEFETLPLGGEHKVVKDIQSRLGNHFTEFGELRDIMADAEKIMREVLGEHKLDLSVTSQGLGSRGGQDTRVAKSAAKVSVRDRDNTWRLGWDQSTAKLRNTPQASFPQTVILYLDHPTGGGVSNRVAVGQFVSDMSDSEMGEKGVQQEYIWQGQRFVKDAIGNFVPRFVERNLNSFDKPKTPTVGQGGKLSGGVGILPSAWAEGGKGKGRGKGKGKKSSREATIKEHVEGAPENRSTGRKNSPFISTTAVPASGLTNAEGEALGGEDGWAKIDLIHVEASRIFDLRRVEGQRKWGLANPTGDKARQGLQDVMRTQEILIQGEIPAAAIVEVRYGR
ncbi:protein of unknown function [Streptomyces zhaozhouensis]|uniref:eCIS core domain-containing protein n=1 Tax=Streptomyces zhaozhouensis TaxID=1300267 RepID=A0A286DXQ6_9ACTN|nr:DUF4157 domain-containing protein [Streptomyces zhaozhouensis]SOD63445.1 protein of unknown function [Streptomyces zhaozhouensis]